jgi:hypothetical protein
MGSTAKRVGTAIATGGFSEVAKAGVKALTPEIPAPPGVPTNTDGAAADKSRKDRRKRKGRASTILSKGIKDRLGASPQAGSAFLG